MNAFDYFYKSATPGKTIMLSNNWSGYRLSDAEKVAIAALALGTTSPEAIADLTGIKKHNVEWFLITLDESGWNIPETLRTVAVDQADHFTQNRDVYPILLQKGVVTREMPETTDA